MMDQMCMGKASILEKLQGLHLCLSLGRNETYNKKKISHLVINSNKPKMEITIFYFYTVSFVSHNQLQNFVFAKLIKLINMYEITCM